MRRLQCSGKQLRFDVSNTDKPDEKRASDTAANKTSVAGQPRILPTQVMPHSVKQPGPQTDEVAFASSSADFPNIAQVCVLGDDCITGPETNEPLLLSSLRKVDQHKHEEKTRSVEAHPDHGPCMEDRTKTQPSESAKTGETIHCPLSMPVEQPTETHWDGEQTEDEEDEDEGHRAPLELMAEFLTAVMCQNFKVARNLCEMILIYEPEHAEARLFLPLIQLKLHEHSDDDDDEDESDASCEDDDDTGDSGSNEDSSQNTGSSLSSSSSSSDDEEEKD